MPPAATIAARLAAWLMARLHSARAASAASSESGSTSPAEAEAQAWPPPRGAQARPPWAEPQAPLKVEACEARGVLCEAIWPVVRSPRAGAGTTPPGVRPQGPRPGHAEQRYESGQRARRRADGVLVGDAVGGHVGEASHRLRGLRVEDSGTVAEGGRGRWPPWPLLSTLPPLAGALSPPTGVLTTLKERPGSDFSTGCSTAASTWRCSGRIAPRASRAASLPSWPSARASLASVPAASASDAATSGTVGLWDAACSWSACVAWYRLKKEAGFSVGVVCCSAAASARLVSVPAASAAFLASSTAAVARRTRCGIKPALRMASLHARRCGSAAEWLRKVATSATVPRIPRPFICPTQTNSIFSARVYHPTNQEQHMRHDEPGTHRLRGAWNTSFANASKQADESETSFCSG
eukprot:scaffold70126_cov67-Phaeocystis_antarctica.AAC.4